MTLAANKAVVQRLYTDIFNGDDPDALAELVAPTYVGYDPPDASHPMRGPESLRQSAARMRVAFPDCRFAVDELLAEGERVAARVTLTGTHTGAFFDLAPTGKRLAITGTVVYRLEGGEIVASWGNWDNLGLMRQLGLLPPQS
jgi:steroid delta-isomerase-like uncharacterized protein